MQFITEGGFPLLASGYLYCSWCENEKEAAGQVGWRIYEQIKPRWFWFSS